MDWYIFIRPLGITTYVLLVVNVLLGLFFKKLKFKPKIKLHKWLGISILLLASIHFLLVLLYA